MMDPTFYDHVLCETCGHPMSEHSQDEHAECRHPGCKITLSGPCFRLARRDDLTDRIEVLTAALREIKHSQGKVCADFETCKHPACRSSYASWSIADMALKSNNQFVEHIDVPTALVHKQYHEQVVAELRDNLKVSEDAFNTMRSERDLARQQYEAWAAAADEARSSSLDYRQQLESALARVRVLEEAGEGVRSARAREQEPVEGSCACNQCSALREFFRVLAEKSGVEP